MLPILLYNEERGQKLLDVINLKESVALWSQGKRFLPSYPELPGVSRARPPKCVHCSRVNGIQCKDRFDESMYLG